MMRYKVTRYDYSDAGVKKRMVTTVDTFSARVDHGVLLFHDSYNNLLRAISPDKWDRVKRVDDAS